MRWQSAAWRSGSYGSAGRWPANGKCKNYHLASPAPAISLITALTALTVFSETAFLVFLDRGRMHESLRPAFQLPWHLHCVPNGNFVRQ